MAARQVWEVHPSPYGVPYYYNPKTKESRWSVPTGPLDQVVPPAESKNVVENAEKRDGTDSTTEKKEEVECISSTCSSSSDSEAPNPLPAAERAKIKVENFKLMLEEHGVSAFDTFDHWLPRLLADLRFRAVPKSQRRQLFQRLAQSLGAKQRKIQADQRRQGREGFLELLELAKAKGHLQAGPVDAALAELERHWSQDSRWSQVSASERQRWVAAALSEKQQEQQQEEVTAARALRTFFMDKVFHDPQSRCRPPSFDQISDLLQDDWKILPQERQQEIYATVAQEVARKMANEKKAEADEEDDLLEKRKRSRLDVAEEDFRALLAKKIRSPLEFTWKEVTMVLDGEKLPDLEEVDLETIFQEVRSEDLQRRLVAFSGALLRSNFTAESSLQEVIQAVEMEEYLQAVPADELKKRWEDWRRFRLTEELEAFSTFLRQCPELQHCAAQGATAKAKAELCERLESDLRYRRLDWVPQQRMKLITARLDEIQGRNTQNAADSE